MKLNDGDGNVAVMSVSHPKVARQFESMELEARDVRNLLRLTPEQLYEWLSIWSTGFRP